MKTKFQLEIFVKSMLVFKRTLEFCVSRMSVNASEEKGGSVAAGNTFLSIFSHF